MIKVIPIDKTKKDKIGKKAARTPDFNFYIHEEEISQIWSLNEPSILKKE